MDPCGLLPLTQEWLRKPLSPPLPYRRHRKSLSWLNEAGHSWTRPRPSLALEASQNPRDRLKYKLPEEKDALHHDRSNHFLWNENLLRIQSSNRPRHSWLLKHKYRFHSDRHRSQNETFQTSFCWLFQPEKTYRHDRLRLSQQRLQGHRSDWQRRQ